METSNTTQAPLRLAFSKLVLAALIGTCSLSTAAAQDTVLLNKAKEITITPVGVSNNLIVFNLKHLNAGADRLYVSLSDQYGDRLYSETVTAKNFDKTYRVDSEVGTVFLTVINGRTKAQEKFEISARTRTIADLDINTVY